MTEITPKIGWIRWQDPYAEIENKDEEEDDFDKDDTIPEFDEENFSEERIGNVQVLQKHPMKVVLTPMGAIPIPEHSAPQKVFNLWVAHTNFNISKSLQEVVENTEGVETLDTYTRYRMRIGIGKMFSSKDTIRRINQNIYQYLESTKNEKKS
jgi:hypothetical protein